MIGGDVLGEPGEETVVVFGDCADQTRLVSSVREFDVRPRAARKPRGTRLKLDGFPGLIDADYCGVHLRSLF